MKKKNQISLSMKEKKLILVLLACVLLFVSYQFGYVILMNKTTSNNKEISQIEDHVSTLELMNINKSMYSDGIEECNSKMDSILAKFVKQETPEDNIMFIRTMEKNLGLEVYEINLYDKALITNLNSEDNQTTADNTYTESETTTDTPNDITSSQFVETGYNYAVDVKFKCSYEELKRMITYINDYQYMRTIQSISVVFDADTGQLIGEMTFNIYTLDKATNEYVDPYTGVTNFGKGDIFGTLH